jgi:hypothetical protein
MSVMNDKILKRHLDYLLRSVIRFDISVAHVGGLIMFSVCLCFLINLFFRVSCNIINIIDVIILDLKLYF